MIKQLIGIDDKWSIIVYYIISNKDYNTLKYELRRNGCQEMEVQSIYDKMLSGMVMGFTINDFTNKISIIGINRHNDESEYLSTIVHEAEHAKEAMLSYYSVENKDEPPAYTIGYIIKRMYSTFKYFICK